MGSGCTAAAAGGVAGQPFRAAFSLSHRLLLLLLLPPQPQCCQPVPCRLLLPVAQHVPGVVLLLAEVAAAAG
jgi:hypothetical protein